MPGVPGGTITRTAQSEQPASATSCPASVAEIRRLFVGSSLIFVDFRRFFVDFSLCAWPVVSTARSSSSSSFCFLLIVADFSLTCKSFACPRRARFFAIFGVWGPLSGPEDPRKRIRDEKLPLGKIPDCFDVFFLVFVVVVVVVVVDEDGTSPQIVASRKNHDGNLRPLSASDGPSKAPGPSNNDSR